MSVQTILALILILVISLENIFFSLLEKIPPATFAASVIFDEK